MLHTLSFSLTLDVNQESLSKIIYFYYCLFNNSYLFDYAFPAIMPYVFDIL